MSASRKHKYATTHVFAYVMVALALREVELLDQGELESILRRDPNQIEGGLRIFQNLPRISETGRGDLLGIDKDGVLVVLEVKTRVDRNQLTEAIDHYDRVVKELDRVRKNILEGSPAQTGMPQILLIAPDFDSRLMTVAKYLRQDVKVRLFRYVAFSDGKKNEIKFSEVQLPPAGVVKTQPPTMEDYVSYIEDAKVKESLAKTREELQAFSDDEPLIRGWRVIFYQHGPRKQAFAMGC